MGVDRHWCSATALFKAVHPSDQHRRRHLWERSVFLLCAGDDQAAEELAVRMARGMEHEYEAAAGHLVRWEFQQLECVLELMDREPQPGTEVYWEFFERVDRRSEGTEERTNVS